MVHVLKIASWQMITQMMMIIFIVNLILGLSTCKSEEEGIMRGNVSVCAYTCIGVHMWAYAGVHVYACRPSGIILCKELAVMN